MYYIQADTTNNTILTSAAAESTEGSACAIVLCNDKVKSARSFLYDETIVIAILTEPIYLSSERKQLKFDLETACTEALGTKCIVTYDMEVYRKIKSGLNDTTKSALYQMAIRN